MKQNLFLGLALGLALAPCALAQSGKVRQVVSTDPPAAVTQTATGGYLGLYLADVNEEKARELKLPEPTGAVVGKVVEGSPAAKAGLRENDVILKFNDETVYSAATIYRLLSETPPGRNVTLKFSRAGAEQSLSVAVGERPRGLGSASLIINPQAEADLAKQLAEISRQMEELRLKQDEPSARQAEELRKRLEQMQRDGRLQGFYLNPGASRFRLGVKVSPLGEQLGRYFGVTGSGVLVTEVEPRSPAERAGLKAGDCITAINGEPVSSSAELNRALNRGKDGANQASEISLNVVRDRQPQTIRVKPEDRERAN